MRYAQKKAIDETEYKQKVKEANIFVPGLNDVNTDLMAKKEVKTFYPKQHPKIMLPGQTPQ